MPISNCVAGGTDTFRKTVLKKELHEDFTVRAQSTSKLFERESLKSHMKQIESKQLASENCKKVLRSGSQNVSRFGAKLLSHITSSQDLSAFNVNDTKFTLSTKGNTRNAWEPNEIMQKQLDEDPFDSIVDYIND